MNFQSLENTKREGENKEVVDSNFLGSLLEVKFKDLSYQKDLGGRPRALETEEQAIERAERGRENFNQIFFLFSRVVHLIFPNQVAEPIGFDNAKNIFLVKKAQMSQVSKDLLLLHSLIKSKSLNEKDDKDARRKYAELCKELETSENLSKIKALEEGLYISGLFLFHVDMFVHNFAFSDFGDCIFFDFEFPLRRLFGEYDLRFDPIKLAVAVSGIRDEGRREEAVKLYNILLTKLLSLDAIDERSKTKLKTAFAKFE